MRLMLGDCLERMKEIPDGSVDLVLCDPPYGTTQNRWDTPLDLEKMWEQVWRVAKKNAAVLMFSQQPFTSVLGASDIRHLRYEWVWKKPQGTGFLNANRAPMKCHENILVFYRGLPDYNPQKWDSGVPYYSSHAAGSKSSNYGSYKTKDKGFSRTETTTTLRFPLDVVEFNNLARNKNVVHPTQKPVDLLEYLIKTYTEDGQTVLDFTMGSGSTGVACVNTGRDFIGIELDEGYFDIAKHRIEEARRERDALLELSDECGGASTAYEGDGHELTSRQFANVAHRIREALGVES